MKKILSCAGEYKKYVILAPIMLAGEVIMEIQLPFIMGIIVDSGTYRGTASVIRLGALMIFISFLSLFFGRAGGIFASKASAGFAKNLRQALFDKIQKFSPGDVNKYSASSLIMRITADVNNIQGIFMMVLIIAARCPLMLIGASLMAIVANPELSLIFAGAVPILFLSLSIVAAIAFPKFKTLLEQADMLNLNVQENLMGIRTVKSFVREKYEGEKFKKIADKIQKIQLSAEKIVALEQPIMQIVINCCIVLVMWFGGKLIFSHKINVGQMTTFISYTFQILGSLMMISFMLVSALFSKASATRILEIFNEEIDIRDSSESEKILFLDDGNIEYRSVNFSYSGDKNSPVLTNINLKINSGETFGIIGGTGSGKSSLVQLLPRLYDPLSGEVIAGGRNVKDYSQKVLRDKIAIVLQKNVLFSGTIRENLLWGNENSSDEEIMEACEIAQAGEFIRLLPDGLNTVLERGATNLSGGQKQRLSIARALLKKPKILILDDSTSAVDNATDGKIRKAFREKLTNMTKIIISQKISSLKDADNIAVMDDGKINGIGSHEYLLANNDIYREIYYSQQENFADARGP
ncbi:MAG: ABC transporter ATP-binding protein/permease [Rickettsiales bacterium]|jgi:ATP-binding cassette subfamily B protein|nr:ABC transporter ATP-binding protein/permease [Rickettsiales bacterium]